MGLGRYAGKAMGHSDFVAKKFINRTTEKEVNNPTGMTKKRPTTNPQPSLAQT
jgi:hypothetical protein